MEAAEKKFYDSVKRDPLFAAEGMDIKNAHHALDSIESRALKYQSLISINWRRKLFFYFFPLTAHVYPVPFLRAFIRSEEERRLFLADPSAKRARSLLRAWDRASRTLAQSTRRFRRMHTFARLFDPELANKKLYDAGGNVCTLSDIIAQVELMEENARHIGEEVRLRAQLLAGSSVIPASPEAIVPITECEPPVLTESTRRLNKFAAKRHDGHVTITETHGPVGYRLDNFDDEPTAHSFVAYFIKDEKSEYDYVRLDPVDLFYFIRLSKDGRYGRIGKEVFQSLIDEGVPYWMQPATRFYAQRDQQYWVDILTLIDRKRRPLLDEALVMRQKSSLLDLLLGTCADELGENLLQTKVRARANAMGAYPLGQVFLGHSHPSLYFLPFNGSVWRLKERVNFRGSGRYDRTSGAHLYEDLEDVIPTLSDDQLEKITRGGRERTKKWKQQGIDVDS